MLCWKNKKYAPSPRESTQDERSWYRRKQKQEDFLKAGYTFLRSVEHQDRLLRVKRFEDVQESDTYHPQKLGLLEWKKAVGFPGSTASEKMFGHGHEP